MMPNAMSFMADLMMIVAAGIGCVAGVMITCLAVSSMIKEWKK